MIEITLPAGNENITRRGGAFAQMYSPSFEVHKWFNEQGVGCIYQPLFGTHRSGDLRHASEFYGLRFKFDDERRAVMFKLTFGGA